MQSINDLADSILELFIVFLYTELVETILQIIYIITGYKIMRKKTYTAEMNPIRE